MYNFFLFSFVFQSNLDIINFLFILLKVYKLAIPMSSHSNEKLYRIFIDFAHCQKWVLNICTRRSCWFCRVMLKWCRNRQHSTVRTIFTMANNRNIFMDVCLFVCFACIDANRKIGIIIHLRAAGYVIIWKKYKNFQHAV